MLDDFVYSASRISSHRPPLNWRDPTIDLVVGYHKLKHPQFLRTFLSKMARTNEQAKANSYLW